MQYIIDEDRVCLDVMNRMWTTNILVIKEEKYGKKLTLEKRTLQYELTFLQKSEKVSMPGVELLLIINVLLIELPQSTAGRPNSSIVGTVS